MPAKKISFEAALHHSNAAMMFYADGDAKLTLSVPASEVAEVAKMLLLLGEKTFRVTIDLASAQAQPKKSKKRGAGRVYR